MVVHVQVRVSYQILDGVVVIYSALSLPSPCDQTEVCRNALLHMSCSVSGGVVTALTATLFVFGLGPKKVFDVGYM